ncbi:endonuclease domain-containing protein, partial [Rhizobiaceae sp. 2RAB30]
MSERAIFPVSKRRAGATSRARTLRQDETEPEYRLWGELRNRRLNGFKFSRQIPIGPYFVDFVCRDQHLVVEIDGGQHSESVRDEVRSRFLNAHGYSVLRFWNHEVLWERRAVLDTLLAALEGRLEASPSPDLRFAPATLSPRGEGPGGLGRARGGGRGQEQMPPRAPP